MLVLSAVYFFFVGLLLVAFSFKRARGIYRLMQMVLKIEGPSYWDLATKHGKELMLGDQISHACKLCVQYGHRPWGLWTSTLHFAVVVSDPEGVADVIKNPHMSDKSSWLYEGLSDFVPKGSLVLNGPVWKWHRKAVGPAFRKPNMDARLDIMCEGAEDLVEVFRQKADGPSFDVTDIVNISITGTSVRFLTNNVKVVPSVSEFFESVEEGMLLAQTQSLSPFYNWFMMRFDKKYREKDEYTRSVIREMGPLFREAKVIAKNRMSNRMDSHPQDLLEALSSATLEPGMDEQHLVDELLTVAVGAMETCRTLLKTMMLLVALHPDVQQRLYEEIETVLGQRERPTPQDLHDMKYLDAVMKESLRLYPSIPVIARNVDKTSIISGVTVPRGSHVVINVMALHRNPAVFENPNKFIPERFLGKEQINRHPNAYIPFGVGLRTCVGYGQAGITTKVFFSAILRNFQIIPGENIKSMDDFRFKMAISISICDPKVRLVSRNKIATV